MTRNFKKPENLLKAFLDGKITHDDYLKQVHRIAKQASKRS